MLANAVGYCATRNCRVQHAPGAARRFRAARTASKV